MKAKVILALSALAIFAAFFNSVFVITSPLMGTSRFVNIVFSSGQLLSYVRQTRNTKAIYLIVAWIASVCCQKDGSLN